MASNNPDTSSAPNGVEVQQLEPQPVLSIRETIRVADLSGSMGEWIPALLGYLQQSGVQPAGPVFVRYHTFAESETDVEIGVPVAEPSPGEGRIRAGELPGGAAISTWHLGPHDDKFRDAYARLGAWTNEHGRETSGPAWEIYYWIDPSSSDGTRGQTDPSKWRTRLVQPVK
jgi:effector-binding domain-containing protein